MSRQILGGCRPTPLAGYLKAIGILRLVAEQKDPGVKGWWEGEAFAIDTALSRDELIQFFCEKYSPTPIVSPWNGGSGFYLGDNIEGLEAILSSSDTRFEKYRQVISDIRKWPEMPRFEMIGDLRETLHAALGEMRAGGKKEELGKMLGEIESACPDLESFPDLSQVSLHDIEQRSKSKNTSSRDKWQKWWKILKTARTKCNEFKRSGNKENILPLCRNRLPDSALQWLDAVYSLRADGGASYNPVLGTYGNEGRLELSNNFMQRIKELFISGDAHTTKALYASSVFGEVVSGLAKAKIGLYDPGRAGGFNQGMEIETKDFKINPWDFVLAMEGALILAGAAVRRHSTDERSNFASPFTVLFTPVGFASSAFLEKGRSETWLPLWRKPASFSEIKYLFSEGRATLGRTIARTGVEFSRAVGTLGVDRGIESFERYAYLERRGPSYVALPAGRIKVNYQPRLELLDEWDGASRWLRGFFRELKNPPATFQSARQRIEEAIFACSQRADPEAFSEVVKAIGNLEKLIAQRDRTKEPVLRNPLYGLSPRWIAQSDDGSFEVRIAASLASNKATGKVGPIRTQMSGVDASNPRHWGEGKRFWVGNSLAERIAGVLSRRLMEAERSSADRFPVEGWLSLSPKDVQPFLLGECDEEKIEELLWGFTLVDWGKPGLREIRKGWETPLDEDHPLSRTWALLKLLHSPAGVRGTVIRREPRILNYLLAGRIREACEVAINRLRVSELNPFQVSYEESLDPVRLMASLLIPVGQPWKLESIVLEPKNPS